jgi:hypothetical protein
VDLLFMGVVGVVNALKASDYSDDAERRGFQS